MVARRRQVDDCVSDGRGRHGAPPLPKGGVGIAWNNRGWKVYHVDTVIHLRRMTLEDARSTVQGDLQQRRIRDRLDRYEARLQDLYGDETACAADSRVPACQ